MYKESIIPEKLAPPIRVLTGYAHWTAAGILQLTVCGLVVWWSGGLALVVIFSCEWWSGGAVVWWSGGLVVWWSDGLVVWFA